MTILVTGATGKQGGATLKYLLAAGQPVRAMTRNPDGDKGQALRAQGAEVVAGDFDDVASLDAALRGVRGVFSVQNPWEKGNDEAAQGIALADAALRALRPELEGIEAYFARCAG